MLVGKEIIPTATDCYSPSAFPQPFEPGAVERAPAAMASGAAGIGGHPVQGAVHRGPVYGLSSGHKGRPHGDLAVGDVLAGLAGALGNSAASQGAGIAEDAAAGGERGLGWIYGFRHEGKVLRSKIFLLLSDGPRKRRWNRIEHMTQKSKKCTPPQYAGIKSLYGDHLHEFLIELWDDWGYCSQ